MRRRKQPRRAGLRLPETFRAAASSQALKHVPCSPLSTVHKCVAAEIPAPSLDTPHPTPTAQTYVSPQDSIPKFGFSTASNQPSAPPKILTSTPMNVTFHDLKTLKPQPPHPTPPLYPPTPPPRRSQLIRPLMLAALSWPAQLPGTPQNPCPPLRLGLCSAALAHNHTCPQHPDHLASICSPT